MRLVTTFLSLLLCSPSFCFFESVKDWLFGHGKDGKSLVLQGAKFEVVSTDEKFLKFANALAELSPLDACYHIVVFSLKKKCGDLSEEDLGKLAVQLLNCQSQAEDRPTFTCTHDMTIAECTKNMDGPTWNAYQIVGNRARAMCYATQQEQFRKMTEMAVNDLATAAQNQIQSMEQLKYGQEMLHGLTTETVRKLFESQQELLGTHQQLRIAQENVMTHVTDNVNALVQEKSLIVSGNKQLADLVENIKYKLDSTAQQVFAQSKTQRDNHAKITEDLNNIHKKAQDALEKLDESARRLLENHREMTKFYQQMYQNVVKINSSVTELMTAVSNMQTQLEKKIGWFTKILGSSEDKLSLILHIGQHVGFYLVILMLAAYLNLPRFSRFVILVASVINGTMEVKYHQGLGFQEMSCVVLMLILANIMYHIWRPKYQYYTSPAPYLTQGPYPSMPPQTGEETPVRMSQTELQTLYNLLEKLQSTLTTNLQTQATPAAATPPPTQTTQRMDVDPDSFFPPRPDSSTPEDYDHVRRFISTHFDNSSSRHSTSTPVPGPSSAFYARPYRSSTPSRSSELSHRCRGMTRTGTPCRKSAQLGALYCYAHRTEAMG